MIFLWKPGIEELIKKEYLFRPLNISMYLYVECILLSYQLPIIMIYETLQCLGTVSISRN